MTAGILVRGDHGQTQIDGDYSNFGFVQGGTLTLTPGSVFGFVAPMVTATLTVTGTAPVVAVNGSGVFVNQYAVTQSGSSWTFYFRAASSVSISASYWVFDTANRAVGASAPEGFRINDQFGVMVCHGGMDPLKVVDFINLGTPPDGWNGTSQEGQYATSRSYSSARTYAVVQASLCRRQEDWYSANQFDYAVQPGNHMQERRILYGASRSNGSYFEFALATGESRIYETGVNTTDSAFTNGQLAWWVVDVSGLGTAPPVNDVTPNPLNWSNISFSTTAEYGIGYTNSLNISGLVQPITLKVSVTGIAETFADGYVYAIKNGAVQASPNRHWTQAGAGSFLVTVQNGDTLAFCADGTTTSGRRTGTATVTITNESDGSTVLDTFAISGEVDSDNNFNILDLTPDAFSVPNLSVYTNEASGTTNAHFQQITGINGTVTLRWTRDSLAQSGNIFTRRLFVYRSTTGSGGPWTEYFLAAAPGQTLDIGFNNGDWFYTNALVDTSAGRGTAQWTNYIHNLNTGTHLATYSISATVDADDNFYASDYTPNPVDWPDASASDVGPQVAAGNGYLSLLGFNQPIQVRHTVVSSSHNFSGGGIRFYKDGAYQGETGLANGSSMAVAGIYAGSQLSWVGYGNTSSGVRSGSICVHVTNDTTGEFIDAFWFHLTADADNNYNLADYVPDAISFPAISSYQPGADPVTNTSAAYTLTGFNQPITMRCYMGLTYRDAQANASSDPFEPNMQPTTGICTTFVFLNGAVVGYTPHFSWSGPWSGAEYYSAVDFTAYPGDVIQFQTHFHVDGLGYGGLRTGAIVGNIYLDSLSGGNRLGVFQHDSTFSV